MNNKQLLTVKEFAKSQNISSQAIYKGQKYKQFFVKYNGKIYIDYSAFQSTATQPKFNENSTVQPTTTNDTTEKQPLKQQIQPTIESENVVSFLEAQLLEKDRQIEKLQKEIAETRKAAEDERTHYIELLRAEQENNRNNQILIAQAQHNIKALQASNEKKGFFSFLKRNKTEEQEDE